MLRGETALSELVDLKRHAFASNRWRVLLTKSALLEGRMGRTMKAIRGRCYCLVHPE